MPDNLNEFFGMFGSERQNVIKGCDIVRHSPLIGPKIPVHGLLLDIETGRLDWVVNGYETWQKAPPAEGGVMASGPIGGTPGSLGAFNIGEMKFPEGKIGELATKTGDWLSHKAEKIEATAARHAGNEGRDGQTSGGVRRKALAQAAKSPIPAQPPIRPAKRR